MLSVQKLSEERISCHMLTSPLWKRGLITGKDRDAPDPWHNRSRLLRRMLAAASNLVPDFEDALRLDLMICNANSIQSIAFIMRKIGCTVCITSVHD